MKKIIFVLSLLCALSVLIGCASDEVPEEEPVQEVPAQETVVQETAEPEQNEVPEPVIENIVEDKEEEPLEETLPELPEEPEVVFTTEWTDFVVDDEENCGFFITTDELGSFYSIEGEFKKDAGNESSCFGFVFGYSNQENGIVPDYFRFAINVKGEYSVHTWDGSSYKDLIDPEADTAYLYKSDIVNTGYGAINSLKIQLDDQCHLSFFINEKEVASGIEPFDNSSCGVMVFFSIGTKKEEKLSESPVQFSYRITDSEFAQN